MKQRAAVSIISIRIIVWLLTTSLLVAIIPQSVVHGADPNRLFVTPSSAQLNIGSSITVNVRSYADSDQSSGSVSGTLTYPAGMLSYTGYSAAGSAYGSPTVSPGSGTIGFSGTRSPATSGSAHIFSVTFKAIGAGSAIVNFANNSRVNNSTTEYNSGVYTIVNPNPPATVQPSPSQTSRPSPSASPSPLPTVSVAPTTPTPSTDPDPQPTSDPTGVVNSVAADPLYSSGKITWRVTATNPASTLSYGASAAKLDKSGSVLKEADGSFSATLNGLTPGVRYYFSINGSGDGGKAGTYSGSLLTKGFPIVISVTENDTPAKNAQIKIGTRNYTTGSNGKRAVSLASGTYTGTITTDTATEAITIKVESKAIPPDGKAPESQAFTFNLKSSPLDQGPGSGSTILTFIGVLVGGALVTTTGFFIFIAYRRRQFERSDSVSLRSGGVIIDDGYEWQNKAQLTDQQGDSQSAPLQTSSEPSLTPQAPQHNAIDEEPIDMFDKAGEMPLPSSRYTQSPMHQDGIEQTPNRPHSTTL